MSLVNKAFDYYMKAFPDNNKKSDEDTQALLQRYISEWKKVNLEITKEESNK